MTEHEREGMRSEAKWGKWQVRGLVVVMFLGFLSCLDTHPDVGPLQLDKPTYNHTDTGATMSYIHLNGFSPSAVKEMEENIKVLITQHSDDRVGCVSDFCDTYGHTTHTAIVVYNRLTIGD